ncbi:MAG: trypsin-like peptidase domain-containing protein [Phycisphaerales bacterium]|nr:trypsin-like peptidase domain-containing protein [Phycisphaerales bacterium]
MDRCVWRRVGLGAAGVALCVGLAVGIGGPRGAGAQPELVTDRATERAPADEAQAAEDLRYARSLSRAFQHAAEHVEPSVVHITTRSDQLVRDFFGRVRERSSSGLGSGLIVSEDGYILTNNHVIKGAGEVLVKLADGRSIPGKVIGGDELRDIAVVRVEATGLTPARLGSDEPLEVGEWVLAVGSPFGFDQTVTAGIVSAMGRGLGIVSDEFKDAEQFIQTDAAINPGNSGGPLINLDGEVVGINSAIFSRTGGSVGLGFSIPIDLARAVYENIIHGGRSDFGWLGVELGAGDGGVRVARVLDDSPAASAGLRVGDVVRRYQGREVSDSTQLIRSIQFTPPGSEARFEVERSGRPVELTARVASRTQAELDRYDGRRVESLGVTVITASEEALGTGKGTDPVGAFVVEVEEGGIAAQAGLQRGDLIVQIGGEPVRSAPEAVSRLTSGGRTVRIDIQRGEMRGYTTLRR